MGNKACTIAIQTDALSYTAGSEVTGKVYVSIKDPNGVPVRSLNICFCGEEKVVIHYTSDDQRQGEGRNQQQQYHQNDHYERKISPIFNLDAPIHKTVDGRIPVGQYEFPFQVVVPHFSPSSMRFKNGQSNCQIRYYMQAYLNSGDNRVLNNFFSNPFKPNTFASSKTYLEIIAKQQLHNCVNGPIDLPPETQRVNKCCCFNQGTMTLKADLDNDALIPNQTYNLNYGIQNDSTVQIEGFQIVLEEHIEFSANHRTEKSKRNLIKLCKSGFVLGDNDGLNPRLLSDIGNTRHEQLCIPRSARTSHSGSLIEIYHRLLIIAKTECCISNPESCIEVSIIGQPTEQMTHSAMPEPSAPFMDTMPEPSAPFMEEDVVVEAMVLPDDWFPVTADIAHLPIATAISQDGISFSGGGHAAPKQGLSKSEFS